MGTFGTSARVLHVLLLSLWLGASTFFIVTAPALFELVSSRHEAAAVLSAGLAKIDLFGSLAGPLLLLTLLAGWLPLQARLRLRTAATIVMTIAVVSSGQWVTPRIASLKAAMGRPLQDMDPSSVAMIEYDQLHSISSGLMMVHVVCALLLLVLAVHTSKPKRSFGIEL